MLANLNMTLSWLGIIKPPSLPAFGVCRFRSDDDSLKRAEISSGPDLSLTFGNPPLQMPFGDHSKKRVAGEEYVKKKNKFMHRLTIEKRLK